MARQAASHRGSKRSQLRHDGEPSVFTCPDCQGALFLIHQHSLLRLECRVGHSYSPESMMEAQNENVERLLWSAARALEEQREYIGRMANQIAADAAMTRDYKHKAQSARRKADAIKKLITSDSKSIHG